jgi:WD40 repeat protein/tRNA A-37 threonylcarbamoyl transferase component Bud32
MPAPVSVDDFLELGYKAGLFDKTAIEAFRQRCEGNGPAPTSAGEVAAALMRDGLLTKFQADHLLNGKWRGFIIAGKYRLQQRVGAGGMGSVYLCEHIIMKQQRALKVLPASQAEDKAALDRFHREARAAGALDHPNIVRTFDIDHEDKLHFLVMEYVDGSNLQEIIKRFGPMDMLRAAHYIAQAAEGLQHAHEAGIVHRDIKPGNLLLDRTGTVKILDMGLARFFHDDRDQLTKQYDATSVLGTADYLAPEQALDSHAVDIRADIYSLGATLYYMLAGQSPFQDGTVAQKLIWHQVRAPKSIQEYRPDVPDDLVAVINKMMAKSPEDRYQVPLEVVEALSPWTKTPIAPPPEDEMPGAGGDAGARSMTGSQRSPSRMSRSPTVRQPGSSRRAAGSSSDTLASPFTSDSRIHSFESAETMRALGVPYVPPDIARERRNRIWILIAVACAMTFLGYGGVIIWAMARHGPAVAKDTSAEVDLAPLPFVTLEPPVGKLRDVTGKNGPMVESLAFSLDGKNALLACADKNVRLWEIAGGKSIRSIGTHKDLVHSAVYSPDGRYAISASWDRTVRLWPLDGGADKTLNGHSQRVQTVAFSPDGQFAASGGSDKLMILWNAKSIQDAREIRRFTGHTGDVWSVAFSPNCKQILSGSTDKTMCLWDVDSGELLRKFEGHSDKVRVVAYLPDGHRALSGGDDKELRLWDLNTGEVLRTFAHDGYVTSLALSADGRFVLTGSEDKVMRLWEVATGYLLHSFTGHSQGIVGVAISPDGRQALSTGKDKAVQLWGLPRYMHLSALSNVHVAKAGVIQVFQGHGERVEQVAFAGDGKRILSGSADRTARLWQVTTGQQLKLLSAHTNQVRAVALSADGKLAATGSSDASVRVWETETGLPLRHFAKIHSKAVLALAFSPEMRMMFSGGEDGKAQLFDIVGGAVLHTYTSAGAIHSVALHPNGKQGMTAGSDNMIHVWALASGAEICKMVGHQGTVNCVVYSPDCGHALSASNDKTIRLWDAETGALIHVFTGHTQPVTSVVYSPEGKRFLSASADGTVRLWDLTTKKQIYQFDGHTGAVTSVAVSPEGRFAVSSGADKTVRLWGLPVLDSIGK